MVIQLKRMSIMTGLWLLAYAAVAVLPQSQAQQYPPLEAVQEELQVEELPEVVTDEALSVPEDEDEMIKVADDGFEIIYFYNADLQRILLAMTKKAKTNLIFPKETSGQLVSVRLYDVTIEEALNAILRQTGFGYIREGKFIYILTEEEINKRRKLVTRSFRLNYISPTDAQTFLEPLASTDGKIITGPATGESGAQGLAIENVLIVKDYEENLSQIEEYLSEIDRRPKQVLVEATILRATLNETNAMGIDFNMLAGVDFEQVLSAGTNVLRQGPNSGGDTGTTGTTGTTNSAQSDFRQLSRSVPMSKIDDLTFGVSTNFAGNVPTGGLSFGVVTDHISVFLRALEAVTDVTVMANPKILALNKQPGNVLVGSRDGYLTATTTETSTIQSVNFLETGTQLDFTPYISENGDVRMQITPRDSTGGVDSNGLPFERTTEITSNILIKDGHTILIGGLFRDFSNSGHSQIPLLGNIPLIGKAFRSSNDSTIREEVIILISVHVIDDEDLYAQYSRSVMDDAERVRIGIRKSMQPFGRERLAQTHYHKALEYFAEGKKNWALWHLNLALHNRPAFVDAIRLREEIKHVRSWDDEGSITRSFIHNLISKEKGLPMQQWGRSRPYLLPEESQ